MATASLIYKDLYHIACNKCVCLCENSKISHSFWKSRMSNSEYLIKDTGFASVTEEPVHKYIYWRTLLQISVQATRFRLASTANGSKNNKYWQLTSIDFVISITKIKCTQHSELCICFSAMLQTLTGLFFFSFTLWTNYTLPAPKLKNGIGTKRN